MCGLKKESPSTDYYLTINREKLIDYNINNLDDTFSLEEILEKSCHKCNGKYCSLKTIFDFKKNTFLILKVDNYINNFDLAKRAINIYNLPKYDKKEITFMRSIFEIKAAVSYKGNIKNGHYECLKKNGSLYLMIDYINPEENNFYDISYFILEKIS